MSSLPDLTLFEARNALGEGDLCPVEYVEALLSRIDTYDGTFHALLDVAADKALSVAKNLKKQRYINKLPPLFGIPFLVKDIIDVEGSITTCQSRASSNRLADKNAECVQRLVDSGAIYLGKTSLYEFALGGPDFDEPWPPARNPWNPDFTPGSSSSGSGAALAAKFAPLAMGTDTGGSIRSPAMMNGVVGLKPTFDRLPTEGLFPLAPSMDTVGPMARTVQDVGIAFSCLAGNSSGASPKMGRAPRLARLDHLWREELSTEIDVAYLFDTAMDDLELAGATLIYRRSASMKSFNSVGWLTLFAEAFQIHRDTLKRCPDRFGNTVREMLLRGAHVSAADYTAAQHLRGALTNSIDECLHDVDGIILPVSTAPPCELEDKDAMADLTAASVRVICNVTGHPALALPIGLSSKGLPLGIQIIGRKYEEEHMIAVGSWVQEKIRTWSAGNCPDVSKTAPQRVGSLQTDLPKNTQCDGLISQTLS